MSVGAGIKPKRGKRHGRVAVTSKCLMAAGRAGGGEQPSLKFSIERLLGYTADPLAQFRICAASTATAGATSICADIGDVPLALHSPACGLMLQTAPESLPSFTSPPSLQALQFVQLVYAAALSQKLAEVAVQSQSFDQFLTVFSN